MILLLHFPKLCMWMPYRLEKEQERVYQEQKAAEEAKRKAQAEKEAKERTQRRAKMAERVKMFENHLRVPDKVN